MKCIIFTFSLASRYQSFRLGCLSDFWETFYHLFYLTFITSAVIDTFKVHLCVMCTEKGNWTSDHIRTGLSPWWKPSVSGICGLNRCYLILWSFAKFILACYTHRSWGNVLGNIGFSIWLYILTIWWWIDCFPLVLWLWGWVLEVYGRMVNCRMLSTEK